MFIWILGLPIIIFVVLYILKSHYKSEGHLLTVVRRIRINLANQTIKKNENNNGSFASPKTEISMVPMSPISPISPQKNNSNEKVPGAFEIDLDSALMLSFLFYDYKEERFYWTSIILAWKAIISIMVTFISDFYIYMSLFSFYILLMWIYSNGEPYYHKSTTFLINISFLCNLSSITLGYFITNNDKYAVVIIIINLLIHLCFFSIAAYLFFKEFEYCEIFEKIMKFLRKGEKIKIVGTIIKKFESFEKIHSKVQLDEVKDSIRSEESHTLRSENIINENKGGNIGINQIEISPKKLSFFSPVKKKAFSINKHLERF